MDMATYLIEIRHACETTLPSVWSEWGAVQALRGKIADLTAQTEDGYQRAEFLQQLDDPDDYMLGVGMYWETYFGPDKERYHAEAGLPALEQNLAVREFACSAMAGSVLQFAKQGISIVHQGPNNSPDGRTIHGVSLKSLLWQSRNQSMHWDEGRLNQHVIDCFETLRAIDPCFSDYLTRSLAFDVLRTLGWQDITAFEADMLTLA